MPPLVAAMLNVAVRADTISIKEFVISATQHNVQATQQTELAAGSCNHILTCAARLFRRDGYASVSMRSLAAEAGLTTGSLYHHFRSKDDLVIALLEQGYRQIHNAVQTALQKEHLQKDDKARLKAAMTAHLTSLLAPDSLPGANIRIYAHVPDELRKKTISGRRAYETLWFDLVAQLAQSGQIHDQIPSRTMVMALFGAMNWSLEWFNPKRDQIVCFVDDLLQMVVTGESK